MPHHVSQKIPSYNLRMATDSLRQNWGKVRAGGAWREWWRRFLVRFAISSCDTLSFVPLIVVGGVFGREIKELYSMYTLYIDRMWW